MRFPIDDAVMAESRIEILKLRFVKGEITQAEYNEMLPVLDPPSASSADPNPLPQASPPPASYKDMVYIPPVSRPAAAAHTGGSGKGMSFIKFILAVGAGLLLGCIVVGFML